MDRKDFGKTLSSICQARFLKWVGTVAKPETFGCFVRGLKVFDFYRR